MIVYQAHNPITNTFYIGKTVKTLDHRKKQHNVDAGLNRNNSYFHKAIRKYGFDIFSWYVLEETIDKEVLAEAEIRWIKLLKDCGHKIYNLTSGGDGGSTNNHWKGKTLSEETREKISNGLKEYFRNNESPTKGTHPLGKKHTEETKRKISQTKLGHRVSEETKQKLREAFTGKELPDHVKQILSNKLSGENNPSAKKIVCITTGEYFAYATLASKKYDVDLSGIIKCCKGKLKSIRGYEFRYFEEGIYP